MVDRFFAGIMFVVACIYGYFAFFVIHAPFQYDPLGPESWPQVLSVVFGLCAVYVFIRPDAVRFGVAGRVWLRLVLLVVLLFGYAELFEPLGFIISTFVFCTLFSIMLGAGRLAAIIFGLATGVVGYVVGYMVLELNLPEGLLKYIM